MITRIESEITQLHQFFMDWYNGDLPATDKVFARLTSVLETGFALISPGGHTLPRQTIIDAIRGSHNSRNGFRIRIENTQICYQTNDLVLATYEEWQEYEGEMTSRVSSFFRIKRDSQWIDQVACS